MENLWTQDGYGPITYQVEIDGAAVTVELMPDGTLRIDGHTFHVDAFEIQGLSLYSVLLDNASYEVVVDEKDGTYYALVRGKVYRIKVSDGLKLYLTRSTGAPAETGAVICAPLHGLVVDVLVAVGQAVETNQVIIVLESMKMENEIRSPCAGTIREVRAQAGSLVGQGDVLAVLD